MALWLTFFPLQMRMLAKVDETQSLLLCHRESGRLGLVTDLHSRWQSIP